MKQNHYLAHTILKADCTVKDIEKKCTEAVVNQSYAVCIPPYYVKKAASLLENTPVKVVTAVGFPMGYAPTPIKVAEIIKMIDYGADEIDATTNTCAIKNGDWNYVRNDIDSMATAARLKGKTIKIILRLELLTKIELEQLCEICKEANIKFIVASVNLREEEAIIRIIQSLKEILPSNVKIKISSKIKSLELVKKLVIAGADRLEYLGDFPLKGKEPVFESENGEVKSQS